MSMELVSLVIPGRNCARTIGQCLQAVTSLQDSSRLGEILFVDDGSTDETADLVAKFPVTYVRGNGKGPGAARNIGWRTAGHPLVWFVDSDCIAQPDALELLLPPQLNFTVPNSSAKRSPCHGRFSFINHRRRPMQNAAN